ncbi:unnamed protein product [Polarella glacialis]|uniref:Uncharacterized protein n=1 Tax=Polarella glacialis TaxID=89957 RepID=A0A813LE03_POLGL|nr:unnamed protein product [Polarella glacialis]
MYHPFHDDGYPRRAEGQQEAWSTDELERAMRESMDLPPQTQPGVALLREEMKQMNLYYESQPPGSDTCGLNALNNLCQRCRFSVDDLTRAEADHAQAQDGGSFAQVPNLHEVPSGFFDVEALKIAAGWADLEFVDVEPVPDFEKSRCFAFAEAARSSADGGWFLGFLVYVRQPGQMHYYALRRDERTPGAWLKLDSLPAAGAEPRNRQLTDEDLWSLYESNKPLFQAWLLRWYPVVYRPSAAREVCRALEGWNRLCGGRERQELRTHRQGQQRCDQHGDLGCWPSLPATGCHHFSRTRWQRCEQP